MSKLPWRRGASVPDGLVPADKLAAEARRGAQPQAPVSDDDRELLARRDALTERFVRMQADLGGTFYEMAIRGHVRMDVLTRKAAELQRVDAELDELERALRGDDGAFVGICDGCGAHHGEHARFCSRCGHAFHAGARDEAVA